jgi:transcriptional regulator with XRE-family HTH domain
MDAAEVAGVTVEQLKRYVRDQSVPPFDVLARLAGPKGVNLNWLADGKGPMFEAAAATRSMPYRDAWEEELVGRISDGIARVYKEEGAKLAPVDQGRLIARIAGKLTTTYDDQAERLIGLKLALEEVRADLRKAPLAEAPSSKRSA